MQESKITLKIRDSDLNILEIAANESTTEILSNVLTTIKDIERIYGRYIKSKIEVNSCGFQQFYRLERVYKIKDRPRGIKLNYSLFYKDEDREELWALIATKRSKFGHNTQPLKEDDISRMIATEAIEDMLID